MKLPRHLPLLAAIGLFTYTGFSKAVEDLTLRDFLNYPDLSDVEMSRDGKYVYYMDRDMKSEVLRIVDLEDGENRTISIPKRNDLLATSWAETSNRILYSQRYKAGRPDWFLYEVDKRKFRKDPQLISRYRFVDWWPANPDTLILDRYEARRRRILHYDIKNNGQPQVVTDTPVDTTKVICDPDTGWPKIAITSNRRAYTVFMSEEKRGLETVYYLKDKDAEWQHLPFFDNDFSDYRKVYDNRTILDLGPDGNTLYYIAVSEHGTLCVNAYDLEKEEEIGEIAANPNFDLSLLRPRNPLFAMPDPLLFSHKRKILLGVNDRAVFRKVIWVDPLFKSIQQLIDKALPDRRINRIYDWDFDESKFLVQSYSDQVFTEYYIFDLERRSLELFGKTRPEIPVEACGEEIALNIPLQDGTKMLAYLRLPAGATERKNLPVICEMPTDMYDRWMWKNTEERIVRAWQGYAVLRLHTRGRPGFGREFFEKGFDRGGAVLQEDLDAVMAFLVEKGIAGPERIALYGDGWGAYLCLEALSRNPDRFCAAILRDPITDLNDYLRETSQRRKKMERWNYFDLVKAGQKEQDDTEGLSFTLRETIHNIDTPILILKKKHTRSYSDQYAVELEKLLKKNDVPCELHSLEERIKNYDAYGIKMKEKQLQLELEFLEKHMQAHPAE